VIVIRSHLKHDINVKGICLNSIAGVSYECLQYINIDEIKDAIPPIGLRVLFMVDRVEGSLNKNNFMLFKIKKFLIPKKILSIYVYSKKIVLEYNYHLRSYVVKKTIKKLHLLFFRLCNAPLLVVADEFFYIKKVK